MNEETPTTPKQQTLAEKLAEDYKDIKELLNKIREGQRAIMNNQLEIAKQVGCKVEVET